MTHWYQTTLQNFYKTYKAMKGSHGKFGRSRRSKKHWIVVATLILTLACFLLCQIAPPSGNFTFAFENLNETINGNSPGTVTGCISGLLCGDPNGVATSVRVVSNTAGYGLGEYVTYSPRPYASFLTISNEWNVSATCEIERSLFTANTLGRPGLADGSLTLKKGIRALSGPSEKCAGLSTFDNGVRSICKCETKLTFKYNP